MQTKRGLCPEERQLGYAKYYCLVPEPPDPVKMQLIRSGPIDPALALGAPRIAEKLFDPWGHIREPGPGQPVAGGGQAPHGTGSAAGRPGQETGAGHYGAEFGYCIFADGRSFMANYQRLWGVTPEMLEWWFVWHWVRPGGVPEGCGNLRYKIWCPPDHWDACRDEETDRVFRDEGIPLCERRLMGKGAYICESLDLGMGDPKKDITVTDLRFEDFGVGADALASLNRQRCKLFAGLSSGGNKINLHFVRPVPGGVELRTRSYGGYTVRDGQVVEADVPPGSEEKLVKNLIHNIVEWQHMQRFLPQLYAEEGWKPVGAG